MWNDFVYSDYKQTLLRLVGSVIIDEHEANALAEEIVASDRIIGSNRFMPY